ncbi:MAG: hypothetical protein IJN82_04990 [Clostridia bacterium]|nr:hypothetical protein [Clostridia bacterium]
MSKYSKFSLSKIIMLVIIVGLVIAAIGLALVLFGDKKQQERLGDWVEDDIFFGVCSGNVNEVDLSEGSQSVKFLENYNTEVRGITSGYYLEKLRDEGESEVIALYNAMLYGYMEGYNYMSIPADIYNEDMMEKAVYYATCDLPIIDLETVLGVRKSSITLADGSVSERYYLYLPTGAKGYIAKKKTAIDTARGIIEEMPEELETELEKAEYLYEWLIKHVKINEEAKYKLSRPHYLYDTLVLNETNYTGISQTYSLLLNLSGIKGFRVLHNAERETEYSWNIVELDGKYYQVDCTADAKVYEIGLGNLKLHFCYSADELKLGDYDKVIKKVTPVCDATDRDAGRIDLKLNKIDWVLQRSQEIADLQKKLEDGADYVTIFSEEFDRYEWEDNYKFVDYWFSYSEIDVKMEHVGKYTCLVYPASKVLR